MLYQTWSVSDEGQHEVDKPIQHEHEVKWAWGSSSGGRDRGTFEIKFIYKGTERLKIFYHAKPGESRSEVKEWPAELDL